MGALATGLLRRLPLWPTAIACVLGWGAALVPVSVLGQADHQLMLTGVVVPFVVLRPVERSRTVERERNGFAEIGTKLAEVKDPDMGRTGLNDYLW